MDTFQIKLALLKHAMNPRTLAALLAGGGAGAGLYHLVNANRAAAEKQDNLSLLTKILAGAGVAGAGLYGLHKALQQGPEPTVGDRIRSGLEALSGAGHQVGQKAVEGVKDVASEYLRAIRKAVSGTMPDPKFVSGSRPDLLQ